jgi:hypothetical protein
MALPTTSARASSPRLRRNQRSNSPASIIGAAADGLRAKDRASARQCQWSVPPNSNGRAALRGT